MPAPSASREPPGEGGAAPRPRRPDPAPMFTLYVLFAVVATLANLATQEIVIRLAPVAPLTSSILAGTAAGFVLKYVLDKRWVFDDRYGGHREELQKVTL